MATFKDYEQQNKAMQQNNKLAEDSIALNTQLSQLYESQKRSLESQIKLEGDFIKQLDLSKQKEELNLKIIKEAYNLKQEEYQKNEDIIAQEQQKLQTITDQLEYLDKVEKANQKLTTYQQIQKDSLHQQKKTIEASVISHKNNSFFLEIQTKLEEKKYRTAKDLYKIYYDINSVQSDIAKHGETIFSRMFGIKKSTNDWWQRLRHIEGTWSKIAIISKSFVKGALSLLSVATVVSKIATETANLVVELETQAAATAALTGRGREYTQQLYDASVSNRSFGISQTETANAFNALYSQFTSFSELTKKTQQEITIFASKQAVLGVEASQTATNLDNLTKALRLSANESSKALQDIFGLSKVIGVSVKQLQTDFKDAFSSLSVYGQNGIKVFKGLAGASKAQGVSMRSLVNTFEDGLNTFEQSADVAGKLNTILGRDLVNSVDLVFAKSPQDRIRLIKEALDSAGKSFINMGKFERIAIANAAGIKNMNEAMKIFNLSLSAYDSMVEKSKNATASQKQFNEATRAGQTFMKKLKIAFQNLAIAVVPIVKVLGFVVDIISKIFSGANALSDKIESIGGKFSSFLAGLNRLVPVMLIFSAALIAINAPLAAIVAGVAALVAGLSYLYKQWHKKGSPALYEMPSVMSKGFDDYTRSVKKATPVTQQYADTSKNLHKVQTKKGSPALWEMNRAMSIGIDKHTSSMKENSKETSKMMETNNNVIKQFQQAKEKITSNTAISSNSSSVQTAPSSQQANGSKQVNVSVDVNFMDQDATKRSFQKAVMEAIEQATS